MSCGSRSEVYTAGETNSKGAALGVLHAKELLTIELPNWPRTSSPRR